MPKEPRIVTRTIQTLCGEVLIGVKNGRVCLCKWLEEETLPPTDTCLFEKKVNDCKSSIYINDSISATDEEMLDMACLQLSEYFASKRTNFNLPLYLEGTPFQQAAWKAMLTIPFGETISYKEEARRAGYPTALRAIGNANHCNPIAIIVPCHRVVASNGELGGYGGGLHRKQFLLELEKKISGHSEDKIY